MIKLTTMTRLLHGNCIDFMSDGEIEPSSVDLLITDPPYNLGNFMKSRNTNLKAMRENFFGAAGWDNMNYDEWLVEMERFFGCATKLMKKGGALIMFMSLMKTETIVQLAQKHGFYYKTTGVWHKRNPIPRNMNLHFVNSTEGWLYFVYDKRTGTFNNDGKAIHDFVETAVVPASEKSFGKHPTQKPEELIEFFLKLLTNEGDTVLDPFMGSGTSGVVARKLKRNFVGVELDDKYFANAKRRIEEALS